MTGEGRERGLSGGRADPPGDLGEQGRPAVAMESGGGDAAGRTGRTAKRVFWGEGPAGGTEGLTAGNRSH